MYTFRYNDNNNISRRYAYVIGYKIAKVIKFHDTVVAPLNS